MNKAYIVPFVLGTIFGCFIWYFGSEILNRPTSRELTPQEEVERMMDCLGIGD